MADRFRVAVAIARIAVVARNQDLVSDGEDPMPLPRNMNEVPEEEREKIMFYTDELIKLKEALFS